MKCIALGIAACFMATTANAGPHCNGRVISCRPAHSSNVTYVTHVNSGRPVYVAHAPAYVAHAPAYVAHAPAAVATVKPARKDIVDTAIAAGSFKTLVAAVQAAGLVDTLRGDGPFTVLAPTDEAFANLPEGTVADLLKPENKEKLQGILTYHVIAGRVMASDVVKLAQAETVQGQRIDISADNGKVTIDGANVIKTDIETSNGVIHVIDQVLLPADGDIVDTAAGNDSFSTLVAAVKAADLVDTLKGDGPFTVFAPTNEAFAKLPEGTVESLLKPENKEKLQAVLTYHVVPGRVYASDVVKLKSAATVNGKKASINVRDGKVFVDDAQVIATDIETSNGVIHVIDSVILP